MAKRKTGLGVEAFFPEEEFEVKATSKVKPSATQRSSQPRRNTSQRKKSGSSVKPASKNKEDQNIERQPAWIRLDHLERLDILKHRERDRLRRERKRVSRSTLIDEAIECYLAEKENNSK